MNCFIDQQGNKILGGSWFWSFIEPGESNSKLYSLNEQYGKYSALQCCVLLHIFLWCFVFTNHQSIIFYLLCSLNKKIFASVASLRRSNQLSSWQNWHRLIHIENVTHTCGCPASTCISVHACCSKLSKGEIRPFLTFNHNTLWWILVARIKCGLMVIGQHETQIRHML